ncbi:hypothetical protein U14_04724 [Candidatus Moduliflexus flocculans]|uniref:Uncharacterized protein n=1 Tax=Candidatus Moduliflexus flocculans TaxID=1499966 RepID=A0A0S6W5S4_9BACT|nr:hypothetical protein U14_04724 [Candidatus Moduliflexus flocculans]
MRDESALLVNIGKMTNIMLDVSGYIHLPRFGDMPDDAFAERHVNAGNIFRPLTNPAGERVALLIHKKDRAGFGLNGVQNIVEDCIQRLFQVN